MTEPSPSDWRDHWHGRTDHPFFAALTERIEPFGFSWIGADIDDYSGLARWGRPLFDDYTLELSLTAVHPKYLRESHFGFHASMFVVSPRQKQVWDELHLWECVKLLPDLYEQVGDHAPTVAHIFLELLLDKWDSGGNPPGRPRWNRVANADAAVCANDLAALLERHLPRILAYVASGPALADLLVNLEALPGYPEDCGFECEARNVCASVLLHDLGRTAEAWQALTAEERRVIAAGDDLDPEMLDVVRCQNKRLKRWMSAAG
ncbi:hypothetical protein DFR29_11562 [Tahibacter aquaticus]|uniref:Uncharacterized protein n=1 Tax=Tahibacter aquaticus TaxID=520092 RepID=A0A4R6YPT0_9GAMM|nr:hypothetical protein [Tahibacter aquaticus]TDR39674.1 hypothetical protein DFR29_11562 [Tahibacter aquaticus]